MNECFNSSFIYGHCSSYQEAKKCCRSCGAVWTFVTLKFIEAGKDWVGGGAVVAGVGLIEWLAVGRATHFGCPTHMESLWGN